MLLPPLLRAHGYMQTQAPPEVWEADTEDVHFIPLLGEMIAAALQSGHPLADLLLKADNVVVPPEAAGDAEHAGPAAGEYVAVTVAGPGQWCADWTWLPDMPAPAKLRIPAERLPVARVRYAYGRFLGSSSSITVFLARHK